MGQHKILELFFEEPNREFQIREIARLTEIPKTTVSRMLNRFMKDGLILKGKKLSFCANESDRHFRLLKQLRFVEKIHNSGLVEYLEGFHPRCIVLFGSFSKGEYHKESDIDVFVQARDVKYDLSKYEKKLRHTINLLFEEDLSKLSPELFNNIINGIKLAGYIKVR